ncbi:response regulator [Kocuria sp. KSNUG]|uniref:response regulator n=1 Tax=Kocuria sp. KSNUG TaxID=3136676 RepID=UPI003C305726
MNWWEPLISLGSAILGAFVGGFFVHRLTMLREAIGARRTQRIAFLLDAYRKLIDASERDPLTPQRRDNLEGALADVMLLGGVQEIRAANRFQQDFVGRNNSSLMPVIESLRKSLREELDLPEVALPRQFNFRLKLKDDEGPVSHGNMPATEVDAILGDGANLLRQINNAQKSKTGRELTDVRRQQLADVYGRFAGVDHKCVLWVDDNEDWIQAERTMLEAAGVSTVWAPNTECALELLTGNNFQAIISDMARDEGAQEGFTLLDAVRQRGDSTPFIVYSGIDSSDFARAIQDRGGQGATNDPSRLFELVMNELSR